MKRLLSGARTISGILSRPRYGILATLFSLGALWVLLWALNFSSLVLVVASAKVGLFEKVAFATGVFQMLFAGIGTWESVGIVFFSAGFGIGLAVIVFILKHDLPRHKH